MQETDKIVKARIAPLPLSLLAPLPEVWITLVDGHKEEPEVCTGPFESLRFGGCSTVLISCPPFAGGGVRPQGERR